MRTSASVSGARRNRFVEVRRHAGALDLGEEEADRVEPLGQVREQAVDLARRSPAARRRCGSPRATGAADALPLVGDEQHALREVQRGDSPGWSAPRSPRSPAARPRLPSPARSGPNSTPTRSPAATSARASAIARSGASTRLVIARSRAVVAKTKVEVGAGLGRGRRTAPRGRAPGRRRSPSPRPAGWASRRAARPAASGRARSSTSPAPPRRCSRPSAAATSTKTGPGSACRSPTANPSRKREAPDTPSAACRKRRGPDHDPAMA